MEQSPNREYDIMLSKARSGSLDSFGNSSFNLSSGKMRLRPASSTRLRNLLINDNLCPTGKKTRASSGNNSSNKSTHNLHRRSVSTPTLTGRTMRHSSSGNLSDGASISSNNSNHKANAVMQIAQRSNASSVKTAISELQRHCDEHNNNTTQQQQPEQQQQQTDEQHQMQIEIEFDQPLQECAMLDQWSVDAYYKVVISKYNGIQAVINAMVTFPQHAELQAHCCSVLKNLTAKAAIQQLGGANACIAAMRNHPHSICVQSEAVNALRFQAPLIIQEGVVDMQELIQLLEHAKLMYLTVPGKESVLILLDFFSSTARATTTTTTTASIAASMTTLEVNPKQQQSPVVDMEMDTSRLVG